MVEELERIRRETGATEAWVTLGPGHEVTLMCTWERFGLRTRAIKWQRRWQSGLIDDFIEAAREYAKRFQL